MDIDKNIDNLLKEIKPEPKIIKDLVEEFIWDRINTQEELNVPMPICKYREYLLDSPDSFLSFASKNHVGFIDELDTGLLWQYRDDISGKHSPFEKTEFFVALRVFLKWCHSRGCLNQEIAENMQFVKDNRMYVSDMDPLSIDIFDIL
jgi:hypothetical protein